MMINKQQAKPDDHLLISVLNARNTRTCLIRTKLFIPPENDMSTCHACKFTVPVMSDVCSLPPSTVVDLLAELEREAILEQTDKYEILGKTIL